MNIPSFGLAGKIAFVTGASRGLGAHFARVLAQAGADVAISSRSLASLAGTRSAVEALGRRCFEVELDVRTEASILAAVRLIETHFGRIDVLVNNAGCNVRKPAFDVTWEDWNTVLDTNLRGPFFVASAAARGMVARQSGRIVNIGSVTSVAGYAGVGPYCASRGGIRQLTMSLAAEWGPHGVTVNCLAPGWFKTAQNSILYEDPEWVRMLTERIPLRRAGALSDLDGALLFLASDMSEYVTGQLLLVDGGVSVNDIRATRVRGKSYAPDQDSSEPRSSRI